MRKELIFSVCSVGTSLCALALTLYSLYATRRHNRLSVRPNLSGSNGKNVTDDGLSLSYSVNSDGLGPARITKFTLFREDKPVATEKGHYVEETLKNLLENKVRYVVKQSHAFGSNTSLRAGEARVIGEVFFPGTKSEDAERLFNLFRDLRFEIEFESFYEEKFLFDSRSGTSRLLGRARQ